MPAFASITVAASDVLDKVRLRAWLKASPRTIQRAKGIVRVADAQGAVAARSGGRDGVHRNLPSRDASRIARRHRATQRGCRNGCNDIERRLIGVAHPGYASAGGGMRRMPGRAFLPRMSRAGSFYGRATQRRSSR
ncbi:GTP-binding protein [Burkholderia seminalis]|nr:GTP-binding protein [Burkholderia seminalis]MCA8424919.1 GTP-binding protein [Burkholderia seminalis]